jgi:hypothetical protein
MILGAAAFENEAETIVSTPRNLCDEPHDTAVASREGAGYREIVVTMGLPGELIYNVCLVLLVPNGCSQIWCGISGLES